MQRTEEAAINGWLWILWSVLFVAVSSALLSGRMPLSVVDVVTVLTGLPERIWNTMHSISTDITTPAEQVMLLVRIPRIIMALAVGTGLAVSGAVYQGVFRNPLVSPDILGVAAGCTFGAALGLILGAGAFGVRVLAFSAGMIAVGAAISMARVVNVRPTLVLVLTGIISGSVFGALFMVLKTIADPYSELPAIVFWVMGSLTGTGWEDVFYVLPMVGISYALFHMMRYRLDVLSMGDNQARALGVEPNRIRLLLIVLSSLTVAGCVASCGQVAWIGLVVPHVARTVFGPGHKRLIPASALIGGTFLLCADTVSRSAIHTELPLSIITSLVGAPVFAWFLYRNRKSGLL